MTDERFLNDRVELHCGDCREVLATLPENSLDACVTDPPYHLTSIVQRFGKSNLERDPETIQDWGRTSPYMRCAAGFMGQKWDGGDVAFRPETWAAVYRVLKPGAHLIAMGGTRTYHRLACAIEDAGFEIRDTVSWLYGSGFPKSHDVSKGIDAKLLHGKSNSAGIKRVNDEQATSFKAFKGEGWGSTVKAQITQGYKTEATGVREKGQIPITAPATDSARQWQGWGTALKPACELIVLARKPLSESTVAANVLRWGTGAINVDGCRVEADESTARTCNGIGESSSFDLAASGERRMNGGSPLGRWPANVVHDGSDEVMAAFPESNNSGSEPNERAANSSEFFFRGKQNSGMREFGDSGSAARFFYTAKANQDDRLGSSHPTVKPLDLMQWLVRLVTLPGGTVLDPFAGTGTTGEAAWREGMRALLIEAEPEYQADIRRRMALALAGPDERQRESIKAKNLPRDDGPLFAHVARETWAEMWAKPFDFSQEPKP